MELTPNEILEMENCPECQEYKGKFGPRHFAARTCESLGKKIAAYGGGGHRTHCTCNSCF